MIKKTSDSFKRYIPQLIIGPMLKMIEAVFDLLIPLFMKSIIDLSRNAMMGLSPLYGMNAISRGISSFLLLFGGKSDIKLRIDWWNFYSPDGNLRIFNHDDHPICRGKDSD